MTFLNQVEKINNKKIYKISWNYALHLYIDFVGKGKNWDSIIYLIEILRYNEKKFRFRQANRSVLWNKKNKKRTIKVELLQGEDVNVFKQDWSGIMIAWQICEKARKIQNSKCKQSWKRKTPRNSGVWKTTQKMSWSKPQMIKNDFFKKGIKENH